MLIEMKPVAKDPRGDLTLGTPALFQLQFLTICTDVKYSFPPPEYDVSGFLGHSEKLSSPEEVIAAGRGVCCGYSNLCTEMCR